MAVFKKNPIFLSALLLLAPLCQAGMQTAIVIANRSPYDVTVNFNGGDTQCIYDDFNPDDLNDYYAAFVADADIQYLGPFKQKLGISDLRDRLGSVAGSWTVPAWTDINAPPFITFGLEMKGSGLCWCKTSILQWDMVVNGSTWTHSLVDHPTSPWELWQKDPSGSVQELTLGPGGYFNTHIFDSLVNLFSSDTVDDAIGFPAGQHSSMTFSWFYDNTAEDDRTACIIGQNVAGSYDCMDTGVALVITNDASTIFAMPLPNVGNEWS